jgi:hypothetical protein
MLLLKRCDQRRHGEEVIAADVQHELRARHVAVEICEIVYLANRKREPALRSVVVLAVLPGWKDRVSWTCSAACAANGRRRAAACAVPEAVLRI